jgi:hypothetical protein
MPGRVLEAELGKWIKEVRKLYVWSRVVKCI